MFRAIYCLISGVAVFLPQTAVCADADVPPALSPSVVRIPAGPESPYELQSALINAVPGDVIELSAGVYRFDTELNVACDNLTIRGAGRDQTVLSFRGQKYGSNGIVATGNAFVIENLAVEDTAGNAIKVLGATDVTFRRVRVEWTDGPKSSNGAYGIYPVECRNVLIDECISIGASDAGIYVGQSQDVVVRNCLARQNVAGIEIENTLRADVYDNRATENTGGILVFDLPGLTQTNGGQVRVFRNHVAGNNHVNFAPQGTMVADVPPGTGVMVMATDQVEIFDNDIIDHETSNVLIVSFLITERRITDPDYDPYPEAFSIHDNRIANGGRKPSGQIGLLLSPVIGTPFPDIFFDGILDAQKMVDGQLPEKLRSQIRDNGSATFANVHIDNFSATNVLTGRYKVDRDSASHKAKLAALKPVKLSPHAPPQSGGHPAVAVYRAAPRKLSEWGFFEETDDQISFAADLIRYELNTPLFSDYTTKHRLVRLPRDTQISWTAERSLEFPVGTVIAKTFAYPDNTPDPTPGERFLETRIELHEPSGWYGYSYLWNDEQTDADLRLGGGAVEVSWTDERGDVHSNHYPIPNANQCLSCHSQDGKFVPLGPTAANLNRPGSDDDTQTQLDHWISHGKLRDAPADKHRPILTRFDDEESSLNARARAWLDVNCAHCHNPLGSARTSGLDLRTSQTDPAKFGVFKSPVAAGKGSGGRRYDIIPGKPDESILMYRLEATEPGARMPNLARNLIQHEADALIRAWIKAMPETATDSR